MAHPEEDIFRPSESRLVQAKGRFLDDIKLPGMCYAAFVRSLHAHAYISNIDVSAALQVLGAIAVLTPEEVLPYVNPVRPATPGSSDFARPYDRYPMPPGGVGVPPDVPTWGSMLSEGGNILQIKNRPWLAISPGIALALAVFGVNLLGDALRDVLDPRLRGTG